MVRRIRKNVEYVQIVQVSLRGLVLICQRHWKDRKRENSLKERERDQTEVICFTKGKDELGP